jgi:hypothetical protein
MPPCLPTSISALRRTALALLISATTLGVGHAQTTTAAAGLGTVGSALSLAASDSKGQRVSDDWLTYEKLVDQTVMPNANWLSVRLDDPAPAAQRLPLTLLVDTKGKVIARYEGRLAPEVWDGVAEQLP